MKSHVVRLITDASQYLTLFKGRIAEKFQRLVGVASDYRLVELFNFCRRMHKHSAPRALQALPLGLLPDFFVFFDLAVAQKDHAVRVHRDVMLVRN